LRAPAAVTDPANVQRVYRRIPAARGPLPAVTAYMSYPGVQSIVSHLPDGLEATSYADARPPIGRGEAPPMTHVAWVAPRYFAVLRTGPPVLGRYPSDDEARVDNPSALVVIGYDEWMSRYGGAESVIGSTIELSRTMYTIIGV